MRTQNNLASLIAIVTLTGCSGLSVDDTGETIFGGDDTATSSTSPPLEICEDSLDTSPAPIAECIMGTLSCGDTVTATNEGGSNLWDVDGYHGNFCFVASTDYDGTERMWEFNQPAESEAVVTLRHCNTSALSVMSWSEEASCPTDGSGVINRCEGSNGSNEVTFVSDTGQHWVIVVDTPAGEEGNFTLSVACN
jgi:hypothetical protein